LVYDDEIFLSCTLNNIFKYKSNLVSQVKDLFEREQIDRMPGKTARVHGSVRLAEASQATNPVLNTSLYRWS